MARAGSTETVATANAAEQSAARPVWRKPEIQEMACGCEINCYAVSSGVRRSD